MKINSNTPGNIGKLYQTYQTQTGPMEKKTGVNAASSDSLQLSDQAKQIHALIKDTKDLPEIREEKIARIKEQITNNTYNIPASKVAAKMLSPEQE
jgi:negative regulator of flagellin synthesis FlgM